MTTPDDPPQTTAPGDVRVREATPGDLPAVLGVLDAAALETDAGRVRAGIDRGEVLVAASGNGTAVGALVLDGDEVANVAVRRRRRGQGIGAALVAAAAARRERLTAAFDADLRPFYESLGFAVEPLECGRFRGTLDGE